MTKDVRYGVTFSVVNVTTCKLHVFHFSSLGANTLGDSIIEYSIIEYSIIEYSIIEYSIIEYSIIEYNAVRCHWEYNSAEYNYLVA